MNRSCRIISVLLSAVLVSVMPVSEVYAQSGINSPYSRYGIGVLTDRSSTSGKAMGGIGAGVRKVNTINTLNPASYSTVDTLTFITDMGFSLQYGNFREGETRVNARNSTVDYMAVQFRMLPKVGFTAAFVPMSNVGYNFTTTRVISSTDEEIRTRTSQYYGEGGLRQFMGGLGWRPSGWLSLGINASFLTGDISHYVVDSYSDNLISSRPLSYTAEVRGLNLDFGTQTSFSLKGGKLVLGAVYTPSTGLFCDGMRIELGGDSVDYARHGTFSLPQSVSGGFSFASDKYTFGADVTYQGWSAASFFGRKYGEDCLKVSAGMEYCPDITDKRLFRHSTYRAGISYRQPYYSIDGRKGPSEYAVGAGISIPFAFSYDSRSMLHVSGQYVRVQPGSGGMITENYFRLNVGVSFMERWFMKIQAD
ncbi:MAG: hypothetical protein J6T18_05750 [Bacteroidaceae bacterium]|nr:hypothetical protein [Bacteroidaceae bacterium]